MSQPAEVMPELGPDQMPENWSIIAPVYERAFEKLTTQFAHEALRQLDLTKEHRVLDVAAGTGAFSLAAAKTGAEVLATDFAPGMIERLRERIRQQALNNITAEIMDGQYLQVADASFDVSVSVMGIIFFPDINTGIAELKRVLKPDGRCVIVCWDRPETMQMMQYLLKAINIAVPDFEMPGQTPVWARLSGPENLHQSMTAAGFQNVQVSTMVGRLEIDSLPRFWDDFTLSAPPLAKLFAALGVESTRRIGEIFIDMVKHNSSGGIPSLSTSACIGIGRI